MPAQHSTNDEFIGLPGGRIFYLDGRDPGQVDVRDITRALCRIDRYGSHGKRFWSVAAHSLLVAHILQAHHNRHDMVLEGIAHDFEEAYIGDVVSPLKRRLYPKYHDIIAPVRACVRKAFGLSGELPEIIRIVDQQASFLETEYLFGPGVWANVWHNALPYTPNEIPSYVTAGIPLDILAFSLLHDPDQSEPLFRSAVVVALSQQLQPTGVATK